MICATQDIHLAILNIFDDNIDTTVVSILKCQVESLVESRSNSSILDFRCI